MDDAPDESVRRTTLTVASAGIAAVAVVWVGTYAALGLWLSALIPFAYQLVSVAGIAVFVRTKRYRPFCSSQLTMWLVLPFLLQWSLGGFAPSSAVSLWALTAPLGALVFLGLREAFPWFAAFVVLVAVSGAIDATLTPADMPGWLMTAFFVMNVVGVSGTVYVVLQHFMRAREREQEKSERLLLNVLPAPIAARLKDSPDVIADGFPDVTVLFADLVGFTPLADRLPPEEVVALLGRVFSSFDELTARHGLEKIKTIGDAYMVAGGLPAARDDHAEAVAALALDMVAAVEWCGIETGVPLAIRVGIDSGPVVAGVIGRQKFSYDLWGDTVNTASRMASHGIAGEIQLTGRAAERLRARGGFELRERGAIDVKGKGRMTTYFVTRRRHRQSAAVPVATAASSCTAWSMAPSASAP